MNNALDSVNGNTMLIRQREYVCDRCNGSGITYVSEQVFNLYMESMYAKMDPGKERFCRMWKERKKYKKTGTIPCPECSQ